MIFDFVKELTVPGENGKRFEEADKLSEYCLAAERNVRIDPDNAMFNIRKALEVLVEGLLLEDGNTEFTEEEHTLYHMLRIYRRSCYFITNKKWKQLDDIRKSVNDKYMHIFATPTGEEKYEIVGEHASWHNAYDELLLLKNCIQSIFDLEHTNIGVKDIPIGDYQIVQALRAKEYESIEGKYKFICRRKQAAGPDTYAYVRPYSLTKDGASEVFNMRDLETQNYYKNMKKSTHIIPGTEIPVADYCDVHFMAYDICENTKTLDEMINGDITPQDFLEIIMQVSEGLSDLITDKISIFHRNIRPTCIFVTAFDDGFLAQLGCFETAKISYADPEMGTLTPEDLKQAQEHNAFVHEKLIGKPAGTTVKEWEAGDVYSLAAILVYCINKNAGEENTKDCTILLDYFSDQFFDEIEQIVCSGSLEVIPTMKEFCAILNDEMIGLKNA